ncbi:MAG TPA: amidase domain-containing protein, partial [Clostridia bacterium]
MFVVIRMKRLLIIASMVIGILFIFILVTNNDYEPVWEIAESDDELEDIFTPVIEDIILTRNRAMMENNLELIKPIYNTNTRNGLWAYEHEKKKMQYLYNWADKQGIKFLNIETVFKVRWVKEQKSRTTVNFFAITDYTYEYLN